MNRMFQNHLTERIKVVSARGAQKWFGLGTGLVYSQQVKSGLSFRSVRIFLPI